MTGRRGQNGWFCTREFSDGGRNPRFAPVKSNVKGDGGKRGDSAHVAGSPRFTSTAGQPRRNSLRVAPFGPPTVSCVLAIARTCIRQAPPTSRGRGLATSAVAARLSGFNWWVKSYSSFDSICTSFVFSQKTLHLCITESQNS